MNNKKKCEQASLSGVLLDIYGTGVLLTGESGVGKSELALVLITRHHKLVADDIVTFTQQTNNTLLGTSPPLVQDFLEVRGIGILNIKKMYGEQSISHGISLELIIHIANMTHEELNQINRIDGLNESVNILNTIVPKLTIPIKPGRNMSILVESAVKNYKLHQTGYHASADFIQRSQTIQEKT